MVFMNCVVNENIPIEALIEIYADVNCISQKHIGELGITYHSENNSIKTLDASYSTLGKVNLRIGFEDGKKYKSIPTEFIVLGPDWPNFFTSIYSIYNILFIIHILELLKLTYNKNFNNYHYVW